MRGYRLILVVLLALGMLLVLASCTATQRPDAPGDAPGFLLGLWHGFIAPIAFIVSIFAKHVRIYAFPNAGWWYDFGFMLGISGFTGGAFAGLRKKGNH